MLNSYVWKIQPFEGELWCFDDHLRSLERKVPRGSSFDEYVAVMLAAAPRAEANMVSEVVENFCTEWSRPRWQEFQENYPGLHPSDVGIPGYVFETPVKRRPVRVLDELDVPSYEELRKRVIKALLGVTCPRSGSGLHALCLFSDNFPSSVPFQVQALYYWEGV